MEWLLKLSLEEVFSWALIDSVLRAFCLPLINNFTVMFSRSLLDVFDISKLSHSCPPKMWFGDSK